MQEEQDCDNCEHRKQLIAYLLDQLSESELPVERGSSTSGDRFHSRSTRHSSPSVLQEEDVEEKEGFGGHANWDAGNSEEKTIRQCEASSSKNDAIFCRSNPTSDSQLGVFEWIVPDGSQHEQQVCSSTNRLHRSRNADHVRVYAERRFQSDGSNAPTDGLRSTNADLQSIQSEEDQLVFDDQSERCNTELESSCAANQPNPWQRRSDGCR